MSFSSAGVTCPWLNMGARNPNSGLPVSAMATLPTKSLSSLESEFY